jgi:hypothetical protein
MVTLLVSTVTRYYRVVSTSPRISCLEGAGRADATEAPDRARIVKCAVEGRAATTVGLHVERRRFVEEVEYRAVHPEVLA